MAERRDDQHIGDLSDELPGHRSTVDPFREKAVFGGAVSAPWVKGEFRAALEGGPHSPYAIGIAVLLLACAAGIPVALLALIATLSHPPGTLTGILSSVLFLVVFGVGTLLLKTISADKALPARHSPPPSGVNGTGVLPEHVKELNVRK